MANIFNNIKVLTDLEVKNTATMDQGLIVSGSHSGSNGLTVKQDAIIEGQLTVGGQVVNQGYAQIGALAVEGVTDRDAAAKLTNLELYASREYMPEAEEDEFYYADLIGLKAIDEHDAEIGVVLTLHNFGAGDIIEIKPNAGGPSLMLPFTKKIVPSIDLEKGSLILVMPEEIAGEEEGEEEEKT